MKPLFCCNKLIQLMKPQFADDSILNLAIKKHKALGKQNDFFQWYQSKFKLDEDVFPCQRRVSLGSEDVLISSSK